MVWLFQSIWHTVLPYMSTLADFEFQSTFILYIVGIDHAGQLEVVQTAF